MNKVSLITAANAMDSKELTHILLSRGHTVVLTYRRNSHLDLNTIRNLFSNELLNNKNSVLYFEPCDIADQNSVNECVNSVLQKYGCIDYLYLIGAMTHVGDSFKLKDTSIITNGQSYYYFLETIKNHSPKTHVFGALTSELAGNVPTGFVFNEESHWSPRSPYSYGKQLAGEWIRHYREAEGLFCCFAITFNHSSCKYRSLDFMIRKLTNSFAGIALGKQKFVNFGFLDFWRDEGYSSFYAEQFINMLDNPKGPIDYVIATGQTHHAEEYLDIVGNYFNLNWRNIVKIDNNLKRPREVVRLIGDSSKIQRDFGFRPNRITFKQHLELMAKYDFELESGKNPVRPNVFELYP